jgi:DNA excision repair protein ERCC-3
MKEDQKEDGSLAVFDEVHHLPANSYSKLSTINTKYRIGLSASPYREDGRTEYIFALTGMPVGMKWQELISLGVVEEPDVKVFLYSTGNRKRSDIENIIDERTGKKIMVFCDSISRGKSLSKKLGVPFVHGETSKRMEKFRNNRVVIGSRVADEGISLPDLDVTIEYDFLYGSRGQEGQRAGRTMHGEGGEHIVMMTDKEYDKYQKRLLSLENQGFRIRFERRK